jgi:gliding motility-associated peptidyl-prolyl isomerase
MKIKSLKIISFLFLGMLLATCCTQKPEAREPISQSSGEFMKQSMNRNKKLNQSEEIIIAEIIKKDSLVKYIPSTKGYWYFYKTKNETNTEFPQKGDTAVFDYDLKDLDGNPIYSQDELKSQRYIVDKQNIMLGLRDGIKLMHKGDKITFLFPSHMGYGYHGDDDKIGTNKPLICTVSLNDIIKEKPLKTE